MSGKTLTRKPEGNQRYSGAPLTSTQKKGSVSWASSTSKTPRNSPYSILGSGKRIS